MALNIYDIIRGPRVTEKAYQLNQRFKQLVLEVHPQANKPLIADALKKLFNVEAEKIRTVVLKGKVRHSRGRFTVRGKLRKKAYITLKEGYTMDLMGISKPTVNAVETPITSSEHKE
jgi:large subunit ribosomal protein L23